MQCSSCGRNFDVLPENGCMKCPFCGTKYAVTIVQTERPPLKVPDVDATKPALSVDVVENTEPDKPLEAKKSTKKGD